MITYQLIPIKSKDGKTHYQARAVTSEMYDIVQLAEHMSNHNTPFSPGAIQGVLTDMVECIRELAMQGKSVKIANLGIFSIGIEGKNVDNIDDWNAKTCIEGVRLVCRATGKTRKLSLTELAQLREAGDYTSPTGSGTSGSGTSSDSGTSSGSGSSSDSGSSDSGTSSGSDTGGSSSGGLTDDNG